MGNDTKEKKFCPSCGENVDTYFVDRSGGVESEGKKKGDICCIFCGMIVEDISGNDVIPAKSILISDDSAMVRELITDMLKENGLTKDVIASKDGSDFITLFVKKISKKTPFSLVILDVSMPILNGVNAAIAMRAIEKALKMKSTPVLFFTAQKCDENFKKVLTYCKPALYVNKGISSTPDLLASRVSQVIIKLLKDIKS
ncbi:MAG: response regulator [Proteobacteria bacterium]|nr:response regulator [Pseudomonadota bacterium]